MWNPLSAKKTAPTDGVPAFTLDQLTSLAIEHWRLETALQPVNAPAPARHGLRKIGDLLRSLGLETQSLDGQPHDPGMQAKVIDRVVDAAIPPETSLIVETVSPLVTLRGQVLRPAEVVVGASS